MTVDENWLVTGAGGFLGREVVKRLLSRGERVVALDRVGFDGSASGLLTLKCDLLDAEALSRSVAHLSFDRVIHLAASHFIPECERSLAATVAANLVTLGNLLDLLRNRPIEAFAFASTADVYKPSDLPHKETDPLEPPTIYGLSKLCGEQLCRFICLQRLAARRLIIFRLVNLIGANDTVPHFLTQVVRQLKQDPAGRVKVGRLDCERDLIPVETAAEQIIKISKLDTTPTDLVVNVGSGVCYSMGRILEELGAVRGGKIDFEVDPGRLRPIDRARLRVDPTRMTELSGLSPDFDLTSVLRHIAEDGLVNA
jgi:UDP-glucose 4-epimerase